MTIPPSVRLALPQEAPQLVALQRAAWASAPGGDIMLAAVSEADAVQAWHTAIARPPLATLRVLVAVDESPVGFAVTGPSDDPDARPTDGQVAEFVVPDLGDDAGRLLNAAVDTLRADGFTRAQWWLRADDDALRAFLTESGWAPDGAHREIGDEAGRYRQKMVRLHTDIS